MDEMLFGSATRTAELIRTGEVSSREITDALLARIDAVNPALNAITELRRDAALAQARASDDAVAEGSATGPLHGLPMSIKDAYHVAGMPTTWGNPEWTGPVADSDATVVQRLKAAGAIIVGKTNVAFMLADPGDSANEVYGATNNPWDVTRTPGGSSGGSAAALAAGLTFLEYGSDLAGSIRVPASFCGIYGLRPTTGTVPLTGFQPPGPIVAPGDATFISALGPMARSAEDLRTALRVTAGPERPMADACSWALAPPRRTRLEDFRVGLVLDHNASPVQADVAAVLSDTVDGLARAGVRIVEGWPEGVDAVQSAESFGFHVRMFFAFQGLGADPATLAELIEHENRRMAARAAWDRYFNDIDVFLCPVASTAAFPRDDRPSEAAIGFWICPPSLPGLPTVAAPVGRTASGLPAGIQIVGPRHRDDTAITFAELLAEVTGGYETPPLS
jgi:amidase